MRVAPEPTTLTVENLTAAWLNNSIRPNPEYQRGSAWKRRQQQLLIDSVLRGYPLPRFYFEQKTTSDFMGGAQRTLEVIDGQQRLHALSEYRADKWPLFSTDDQTVPLPPSIRDTHVPWSGKGFSSLPIELQQRFLNIPLSVVIIDEVTSDEVRDLFIRLQSGTPLTAQQVRDAWPGAIGPFIERLARKGTRQGVFHTLFSAIDKRGSGISPEDSFEDPYLDARQTCAQLLLLFLALERGRDWPSLRSPLLNNLYHEETAFDTSGPVAQRFERVLSSTQDVLALSPVAAIKRVRKSRIVSLFLFLRALSYGPVNQARSIAPVAALFWSNEAEDSEPNGRVGTAETIKSHYKWMVEDRTAPLHLPELASQRFFDNVQKAAIWNRFGGRCGICTEPLIHGEEEYDHIKPWILGGPTTTENGRPVHSECHARGLRAVMIDS
jgi:hypothetical protein